MLTAIAAFGGANPTVPAYTTTAGPYTARDFGCGVASLLGAAPVPDFADPSLTQVCIVLVHGMEKMQFLKTVLTRLLEPHLYLSLIHI